MKKEVRGKRFSKGIHLLSIAVGKALCQLGAVLALRNASGKHVEDQPRPTSGRGAEAPETLSPALSASRKVARALSRGITRVMTQPKSKPLGSRIGSSFVDHHAPASFSVNEASVPYSEPPSGVSLDYMFLPMAAGGLRYACGGERQVFNHQPFQTAVGHHLLQFLG